MNTLINDRIDLRISKEQKELIKYASDLSGFKSLTEFIIFCANKESNEIIIEHNKVLKSLEDKKVFLAAILNPPAPNAQLKKAQLNYLKFIDSNEVNNTGVGKKARKKGI
jgi:uncharacterized protein (DUF1778 family)